MHIVQNQISVNKSWHIIFNMHETVLSFPSQTAHILEFIMWLKLPLICLSHWVRNLEIVNKYTLGLVMNCTTETLSVPHKKACLDPQLLCQLCNQYQISVGSPQFISNCMVWKMFLFIPPLCHCYFLNKEIWFMASSRSRKV